MKSDLRILRSPYINTTFYKVYNRWYLSNISLGIPHFNNEFLKFFVRTLRKYTNVLWKRGCYIADFFKKIFSNERKRVQVNVIIIKLFEVRILHKTYKVTLLQGVSRMMSNIFSRFSNLFIVWHKYALWMLQNKV